MHFLDLADEREGGKEQEMGNKHDLLQWQMARHERGLYKEGREQPTIYFNRLLFVLCGSVFMWILTKDQVKENVEFKKG